MVFDVDQTLEYLKTCIDLNSYIFERQETVNILKGILGFQLQVLCAWELAAHLYAYTVDIYLKL